MLNIATSHRRGDSRSLLNPPPLVHEASTSSFSPSVQYTPHHPLPSPTAPQTKVDSTFPTTQSHTQLWLSTSQKLANLEGLSEDETSVFGAAHAKALEDLRTAQVQLAQAWMRSECEDVLDGEHAELAKRSFGRDGAMDVAVGVDHDMGGGHTGTGADQSVPASGLGIGSALAANLGVATSINTNSVQGDGMENDILLARKRREFNDAHFHRVSLSVADVIQKLENVAGAMGVVEAETKEIWGSEASDES